MRMSNEVLIRIKANGRKKERERKKGKISLIIDGIFTTSKAFTGSISCKMPSIRSLSKMQN